MDIALSQNQPMKLSRRKFTLLSLIALVIPGSYPISAALRLKNNWVLRDGD